jgi:hypothetical protein
MGEKESVVYTNSSDSRLKSPAELRLQPAVIKTTETTATSLTIVAIVHPQAGGA